MTHIPLWTGPRAKIGLRSRLALRTVFAEVRSKMDMPYESPHMSWQEEDLPPEKLG